MNESPELRVARALRTNVPTNMMNVALMIIDEDHDYDDGNPEPWIAIPMWLVDLFKQKPLIQRASHGAYCTCDRC